MNDFLDQVKRLWQGLNQAQRAMVVGVTLLALSSFLILTIYSGKQNQYEVLFSNLEAADAGMILEKLKDQKVSYEVQGSSILVPPERKYDLRIMLASEGLPRGSGVGFEIFDKTSIGMTDFVQKLNYQRALQGELSRTISKIGEVVGARVHLVVPETALFKEDQKPATASIVLILRGSASLGQGVIHGIVHLVASAVEGLAANNITMMDSRGNMLYKGQSEDSSLSLSNTQLEMQSTVENYLAGKGQMMLDSVLGMGNGVVKVTVDLDFEQLESTREKFDPEAVVKSETLTEEASAGSSPVPSGPAGTDSNIDSGAAAESAAKTTEKSKSTTQTIFEVGKVVEHRIKEVGGIRRMSVAVLIKQRTITDEEGNEQKMPSDDEVLKYNAIIKQAVGFDPERSDQFELKAVPYETYKALTDEQMASEQKYIKSLSRSEMISNVIKYGAFVVFGVVLLVLLRSTVIGIVAPRAMLTLEQQEAVKFYEQHKASEKEGEEGDKQVEDDISPEAVARILKGWLAE